MDSFLYCCRKNRIAECSWTVTVMISHVRSYKVIFCYVLGMCASLERIWVSLFAVGAGIICVQRPAAATYPGVVARS